MASAFLSPILTILAEELNGGTGSLDEEHSGYGGLTIVSVRSRHQRSSRFEFRPREVIAHKDGFDTVIWMFERTAPAIRATVCDYSVGYFATSTPVEPVIAIIDDASGSLEEVLPLDDLPRMSRVTDLSGKKTWVSPRPVKERVMIKVAIAEMLGLVPIMTQAERILKKIIDEESRKAREAQRRMEEEERRRVFEERTLARQARQRSILSRQKVSFWFESGEAGSAIPVTNDEYPSLPDNTPVLLVEWIAGEKVGKPISFFFTKKDGGVRTLRMGEKAVFMEQPAVSATQKKVIVLGEILVNMGKSEELDLRAAALFASVEDVRSFRASNPDLNGGTLVATRTDKPNLVHVYSLNGREMRDRGHKEMIS